MLLVVSNSLPNELSALAIAITKYGSILYFTHSSMNVFICHATAGYLLSKYSALALGVSHINVIYD